MAATSCRCPVRYEIVVQQTSAVRSSIAAANFSAGIEPSALRTHVNDLGAAKLLGVSDLADGGELVLADHDARATAALERQGRHDRVHTLRDRCRHRDLVGLAVQEPRKARAGRFGPLDPELPLCAVRVPAREVLLVCVAHAVGERTLRARVEIRRVLEDREFGAHRVADATGGGLRPLCAVGAHGPTTYDAATSGVRYAAEGLPAGVKIPSSASSRSVLVFSTMCTSRGVIRNAEPSSSCSVPSAR